MRPSARFSVCTGRLCIPPSARRREHALAVTRRVPTRTEDRDLWIRMSDALSQGCHGLVTTVRSWPPAMGVPQAQQRTPVPDSAPGQYLRGLSVPTLRVFEYSEPIHWSGRAEAARGSKAPQAAVKQREEPRLLMSKVTRGVFLSASSSSSAIDVPDSFLTFPKPVSQVRVQRRRALPAGVHPRRRQRSGRLGDVRQSFQQP
jgi:hypothetical protein